MSDQHKLRYMMADWMRDHEDMPFSGLQLAAWAEKYRRNGLSGMTVDRIEAALRIFRQAHMELFDEDIKHGIHVTYE
jgi:hypothetical protein